MGTICKCKICGKELPNKRAAHGHLITTHTAEYREKGMQQSYFMDYYDEVKEPEKGKRPEGFRPLSDRNSIEAAALAEGYDFIDADQNAYTLEEVKEMGWI